AALDALTTAPAVPKTVKLTIPEGRSRREIVPLVKQLGLTGSYMAATARSPRSLGGPRGVHTLEGYLFPATYQLKPGAPVTPLGNPGLSSLQAAAHPAHEPYLFYVVKPCGNGGHAFSSTEAKFQADVAKYNAARQANGGNSPKTC